MAESNEWGPDEDPFEESRLNPETPGLDAQEAAGIGPPPVNAGDKDENFTVDLRDSGPPGPWRTQSDFTEIIPPQQIYEIGQEKDNTWSPHSDDGFGLPLMKACIKDDLNGETDFTTQIGRIYWRREGAQPGEGEESGSVCDPCITEMIGTDCFAPKEHDH